MLAADFEYYRAMARRRLPAALFDYIDGAAFDEMTANHNTADLRTVMFRQRVMRGCGPVAIGTEILGEQLTMPLILGPAGMAGFYARRGDVQAARAATKAGLPFCLSTVSTSSIEELADATTRPPWFQLYMLRDRAYVLALLQRAARAGSSVLILTADAHVPGTRYRDIRSGILRNTIKANARKALGGFFHPRWMWDVWLCGRPLGFGNIDAAMTTRRTPASYRQWIQNNFEPVLRWDHVAWLRSHWTGKIVIKGIHDVEDAIEAVRQGVDAIVVSNHGGRQLDGVASSIRALCPIVQSVGGEATVLIDSGIRSGLDILKALALGAKGCLIGRAWTFAVAAGGEEGVTAMLESFSRDLHIGLALVGVDDVTKVDSSILSTAF